MIRVIQWSTGNVGRQTLAAIVDHPELELVGVFAHGPEKVGRDAGELCSRGRQGVEATGDVDALVELDADCVCYTPLYGEEDLLVRLLGSGKNVVTTSGYVFPAAPRGPAFTERIEAACRKGSASLLGTGLNPGFLQLLAIVLSIPCRRIESVTFEEFAYAGLYNSPEVWRAQGFGLTPEERAARLRDRPAMEGTPASMDMIPYLESVYLVADALGIELDGHEHHEQVAVATRPIEVAWTTYPPGTVAGLLVSFTGLVSGRPVITSRLTWYMGTDIEPCWVSRRKYGRVVIEGEPRLTLDLGVKPGSRADPALIGNLMDTGLVATGMPAVNAIPAVCAAEPGIRTYRDLPLTLGTCLFRR